MHCNSCGTLNQPSSHFCVKCGANLDAQRAVQSALAASPPVQTVAHPMTSPVHAPQAPEPKKPQAGNRIAILIGAVGWILTGLPYIGYSSFHGSLFINSYRTVGTLFAIGYLLMSVAVAMSWASLKRRVPIGSIVAIVVGLFLSAVIQGVFAYTSYSPFQQNFFYVSFAASFVISGAGAVIGAITLKQPTLPSA